MEDTKSYRARKRQRRRHLDRLDWLMQRSFQMSYGIAVVGIVLLLYDAYPWWVVLLGLPVELVAGLGFAGLAWIPFSIPIFIYQWMIDHIYAEEKSGDSTPIPDQSADSDW